MLQLDNQPLVQLRNTMMTVLRTVTCMRVSKVDQPQLRDALWLFDAAFHINYAESLACHIYKRKQDTARKDNITGFFPAKRQIFSRNSTTRFRRSTIVYNASVTEA